MLRSFEEFDSSAWHDQRVARRDGAPTDQRWCARDRLSFVDARDPGVPCRDEALNGKMMGAHRLGRPKRKGGLIAASVLDASFK